jgi:hypothetical protein
MANWPIAKGAELGYPFTLADPPVKKDCAVARQMHPLSRGLRDQKAAIGRNRHLRVARPAGLQSRARHLCREKRWCRADRACRGEQANYVFNQLRPMFGPASAAQSVSFRCGYAAVALGVAPHGVGALGRRPELRSCSGLDKARSLRSFEHTKRFRPATAQKPVPNFRNAIDCYCLGSPSKVFFVICAKNLRRR